MARTFKVMLVALVVLVLAGSVYAFAAANTIAPSNAGYKASEVSGYAIANVVYGFKTGDPTKLTKITFDIAPISPNTVEPVTVQISTTTAQDFTTSTCAITKPALTSVATCTFTSAINVDAVVALDIVASSNPLP